MITAVPERAPVDPDALWSDFERDAPNAAIVALVAEVWRRLSPADRARWLSAGYRLADPG